MKLSKAQQEVMDRAKEKIDFARTHTVYEWAKNKKWGYVGNEEEQDAYMERLAKNFHGYRKNSEKEVMDDFVSEIERYAESYHDYYENERNGIVLTRCNSRTLVKLEQLGLIEIIFDSNGASYGLDTIKVLNY